MKRTLIVIVLSIAALALLAGAALKSRSIPLEAHIAYYTLSTDLERLREDHAALLTTLEAAWQARRPPDESAEALHARLVDSLGAIRAAGAEIPAGSAERERIDQAVARLAGSIATLSTLADQFAADQAAFSASLDGFREQGTEIVRQLRANGRSRMATELFQLMAETIEVAESDAAAADTNIPLLLVSLNRDLRIDSNVPRGTPAMLEQSTAVLDLKDAAASRLYQLGVIPVAEAALGLAEASAAAYEEAAAGADGARMILSIYVIVLLLALAVIGWRLRSSYRQLNRANDELGELNESLEQRVIERTAELSNALTELKESQVQLVQAEKMSSLGQLVAGISHEINTPLLYLANNAELTQERIGLIGEFVRQSGAALCADRADFASSEAYRAHLIEGLRRLKRLLREQELEAAVEDLVELNRDSIEGLADLSEMAQSLKDFSRLDRAPVDSFDVNAGIEKTLTIARNIVKHKAEVIRDFGELPPIECSPSKINQVFLNLITNAAQAIEDHGEIRISTALRDDEHIVIAITDDGCGIPKEHLAKIRDPFFTTKEVGAGTGLGLSIVDEIVRSHGGQLLVESKLGVGSTFSIVLPIRQQQGSDEAAADSLLAEAV